MNIWTKGCALKVWLFKKIPHKWVAIFLKSKQSYAQITHTNYKKIEIKIQKNYKKQKMHESIKIYNNENMKI